MKYVHDCKIELNDVELKATPARIAVLKVLEHASSPIDVSSILHFLRKQHVYSDEATIFRMMNTFTEKGITRPIQLQEGKFRYELASKPEHHHFVCEACGMICDISSCIIGKLEKEIEHKNGFKVKSHSLEFFGLCNNCK